MPTIVIAHTFCSSPDTRISFLLREAVGPLENMSMHLFGLRGLATLVTYAINIGLNIYKGYMYIALWHYKVFAFMSKLSTLLG